MKTLMILVLTSACFAAPMHPTGNPAKPKTHPKPAPAIQYNYDYYKHFWMADRTVRKA